MIPEEFKVLAHPCGGLQEEMTIDGRPLREVLFLDRSSDDQALQAHGLHQRRAVPDRARRRGYLRLAFLERVLDAVELCHHPALSGKLHHGAVLGEVGARVRQELGRYVVIGESDALPG